MPISDYIAQNLVDPEKHARILNALIAILEEEGERGLKDQIAQWISEIQEDLPDEAESKV
jgi:hypothetical protein